MKLLFEGYAYPLKYVEGLLSSHLYTINKQGTKAIINCVGYFFCNTPQNGEVPYSVFILPKVFLNNKSEPFELEGLLPEQIIEVSSVKDDIINKNGIPKLVFELSVWLYQALQCYSRRMQNSTIVENSVLQNVISHKGEDSTTYIDIILQLKRFYSEHRNLLTFTSIVSHLGKNKIHWRKTINSSIPVFKKGKPFYLQQKANQRVINFDEEIVVLYVSVLNYLKKEKKIHIDFDLRYDSFSPKKIQQLINDGKGTTYLKRIRKNYFKDDLVCLWKLLYAFFDKSEKISSRRYHEELLISRDFDKVFEDMVNYLISDDDCPAELVKQRDNKVVDHLYRDKSLLYDENIFFLGDSKYYKPGRTPADDSYSVFKQYTYAKNIIQRNINVIYGFEDGNREDYYVYRDDLTEGYNITPNFLISGIVKRDNTNNYIINTPSLENVSGTELLYNRHFSNRLFDRDTLILQKYNINFLYVLTAYASQDRTNQTILKSSIRKIFRDDIIKTIENFYDIYQICLPKSNDDTVVLEKFVNTHFRELIGRIFSFNNILIYAEHKSQKQVMNNELKLKNDIVKVRKVILGKNIKKEYN